MRNNNFENIAGSVARNVKQQVYDGSVSYTKALNTVQKGLIDSDSFKSKQIDEAPAEALKAAIRQYIVNKKIKCDLSNDVDVLVNHMYHDMAEMSFISRDNLFEMEGFEELNINAWNAVEIVINGVRSMTDYSFLSAQRCIDIHKRIFNRRNKILDLTNVRVTTDIVPGVRICVWGTPIVDDNVGIASSIRKVNTKNFTKEDIIEGGSMSEEMFDLLHLCLSKKASVCMSGETSAGKTTYGNTLLSLAAREMRVITIEDESREWDFVKSDENGKAVNSVIHTKTVENTEDPTKSVSQRELIKDALRFHPDILAPSEVRDDEAYDVMEAANTGHGVLTTVHSNCTASTPQRFIALAKKKYAMDDATLLNMFSTAFPILAHFEKCPDGVRRLMEIREILDFSYGEIQSQLLYEFVIEDNRYENGVCVETIGEFKRLNPISLQLTKRLLKKGATKSRLLPYLKPVDDNNKRRK